MNTIYKFCSMLTVLLSTCALSNELIMWEDLIPPPSENIEVPALNQQQVNQLFAVLNHQTNSQTRALTEDEKRDLQHNTLQLKQAGFDANTLLALRARALEIEHQRLTSVNTKLDLRKVTIPGFVVPLEMDGMLTTKFLLVPIAGACIHTPPPPANQTIIVDIDQGFNLQDLYKVITVSGDIKAYEQDLPISFVDGTEVVSTGYTMKATTVNYVE
ncbi:DUF3299 domain-containing protein [Vibrio hippocampi]|uniref:DUF3299 domain-containing protein n=1 Tax=Vibrio hippocampi TaxID=654686 RepID=A0ABN8DRE9_9VIBR|nr:DUF3299 domain-containing protein [Vibrio hippocampi]CAH0530366.1 hypothetical protein VHP8226_04009 [Vibrio hippocampi]